MKYTSAITEIPRQSILTFFFMGLCLLYAHSPVSVSAEEIVPHIKPSGALGAKFSNPDKPGLFKIDQSTDDSVCRPLTKIINQDIKRYGKTQFEEHTEFVKWQKVDEANIDRGEYKYDGEVEQAEVDINNDGVKERVIRTGWSIREVLSYRLDALPLEQKIIDLDELSKSEKKVEFNVGKYSIGSYVQKYGHENYGWYFDGVASIHLFTENDKTYALAQNYAAPSDVSAKIYIFRLDKNYDPQNVCMLVKICPCGGCKNSLGDKTLPAKKWCGK